MTLYYCKETGEDMKPNGDCLIHGKQPMDHFEEEKENMKQCDVCDCTYYCIDDLRKVCSMDCAGKYNV